MIFYQPVLQILSVNKILTSTKGHSSVINKQTFTGNNPNLDLVNINAYSKFDDILSTCSSDIERKRISGINQEPLFCYKFAKNDTMLSQPRSCQYLINEYTKFGRILSICSVIERKRNSDINQCHNSAKNKNKKQANK